MPSGKTATNPSRWAPCTRLVARAAAAPEPPLPCNMMMVGLGPGVAGCSIRNERICPLTGSATCSSAEHEPDATIAAAQAASASKYDLAVIDLSPCRSCPCVGGGRVRFAPAAQEPTRCDGRHKDHRPTEYGGSCAIVFGGRTCGLSPGPGCATMYRHARERTWPCKCAPSDAPDCNFRCSASAAARSAG